VTADANSSSDGAERGGGRRTGTPRAPARSHGASSGRDGVVGVSCNDHPGRYLISRPGMGSSEPLPRKRAVTIRPDGFAQESRGPIDSAHPATASLQSRLSSQGIEPNTEVRATLLGHTIPGPRLGPPPCLRRGAWNLRSSRANLNRPFCHRLHPVFRPIPSLPA